MNSSTLMNKILEIIEAQKLFNIPMRKLDILIHPNSLVHAIVEFKNGLSKFIYHKTSMIIPLANAIFDGILNIENFYKKEKINIYKDLNNFIFKKVNKNIFSVITKIESSYLDYYFKCVNEILVDQFLKKRYLFEHK